MATENTGQQQTGARVASIQASFEREMASPSSQRLFTELDAFRGRLYSEIASGPTAAIIWWVVMSMVGTTGIVLLLGGANWLEGQWVLSGVLVVLSALLATGCATWLPDASNVLEVEDILWCSIVGTLCTFYCYPQLLLAQDLMYNFSQDIELAKGSYQGIFWSCVLAMISVPLYAIWQLSVSRAWTQTFQSYRTVPESTCEHNIVALSGNGHAKSEQQPLITNQDSSNVDLEKKQIFLEGCSDGQCTVRTDQPAVLVSDHYGTFALTKPLEGVEGRHEATIRVVAGERLVIFKSAANEEAMSQLSQLTHLTATSYQVHRQKPHAVFVSSMMVKLKEATWGMFLALLVIATGLGHNTIPSLYAGFAGEPLPCLIPMPSWLDKPSCVNAIFMSVADSTSPSWGFYNQTSGESIPADVAVGSSEYFEIIAYFLGFVFSSLVYGLLFCRLPVIVMRVWSAGNRLRQLNDLLMVHKWNIGGHQHRQALMLYKLHFLRASIIRDDMRRFYELEVYPDFRIQEDQERVAESDSFFWWFRTRAAIFADTSLNLLLVSPLLYLALFVVMGIIVATLGLVAQGTIAFPLIAYTVIDGIVFGAFMLGFMLCGSAVNAAIWEADGFMSQLPEVANTAVQDLLLYDQIHAMQLTFLGIPVGSNLIMAYGASFASYAVAILVAIVKGYFIPWVFQLEPH